MPSSIVHTHLVRTEANSWFFLHDLLAFYEHTSSRISWLKALSLLTF